MSNPNAWKPGGAPTPHAGRFKKGDPRINPGGKISIAKDLERARLSGVPAEIADALTEWFDDAPARLADLGADGFVAGLRGALDDATKRVLPIDPAEARAMWWRTIWPVFMAGPSGTKDSVWVYTAQEVGVRLLGKPKETISVENGDAPPAIDWNKIPEGEREEIGAALVKLQGYLSQPESPTEH